MTAVTRRSAIRTSGLAAIAAGLLSATTQTSAAPLSAAAPTATVIYVEDLAAESRQLHAEAQEATARSLALYNELWAQLPRAQQDLLRQFSDAQSDVSAMNAEHDIAELARHLPGLAPTVRLLWLHLNTSTDCCTVASGFAP